ncbi:MAG TPA: patatin-like phospholipase family protein [Thermoanaerobaculia bacterium]|nr:patatin-like phospholipase family protein [Thermoanaerobaculia bacterium]
MAGLIHNSSFIVHRSSFIVHRSSFHRFIVSSFQSFHRFNRFNRFIVSSLIVHRYDSPVPDLLECLSSAKNVAYVFSGGSSRCAFQVGVVERLRALGVRPAVCIGVSAGAWNAAIVAARREHRIRFFWKSFMRMPHVDLRNLVAELSPWRYAHMHRRNFARFIGGALASPEALPCYISLTRLRDRENVMLRAHDVDAFLAANYLPPFYTRTPLIDGERYGDGGVSDNAPYEFAFQLGCDAVVLMVVKGESEGGIYKNARDIDHVIADDRVIVIRPRHRVPVGFLERRWEKLEQLMVLGDLRTREVLLGERHAETDIRAAGEAPSVTFLRLLRRLSPRRARDRESAEAAPGPATPEPR